jgi:WD40 repeat protein
MYTCCAHVQPTIGGALVSGHCADELWGLAVHPIKPRYLTCGDDKTLRVWDIHTLTMVGLAKLDTMARAVAVSPDGQHVAVGLGGRVGRGKCKGEGGYVVLRESDLSVVKQGKDSDEVRVFGWHKDSWLVLGCMICDGKQTDGCVLTHMRSTVDQRREV